MNSRYSVGDKVYRGGSSAPTMGTVDPMGYIDRGLRQKMAGLFSNAASQTRSGLAAAALRRQQGMPTGTPNIPIDMQANTPLVPLGSVGSQLASGHITPQIRAGVQKDIGTFNNAIANNSDMRSAIQRHFPQFGGKVNAQGLGNFEKNMFNPDYMQQHGFTGVTDALKLASQSGTPVRAFNQALTPQQHQGIESMQANMQQNMPTIAGINKNLLALLMQRMRGQQSA
jgi:hypothetical protein